MRILVNCFGVFVPKRWLTYAWLTLGVLTAGLFLQAGAAALPALGLFSVFSVGMILDELTEFADATSVAAAAGTALIGDVIDLGTAARDVGNGEPVYLVITVDTEIITGGVAGTINFKLASDAQAAIATDGTATVHFQTRDFVTDDAAANDAILNAGGVLACIALPTEGPVYERFLGILATIGTTTVTAGKINAFLTKNPGKWKAYPNAANS